MKMDYPTKNFTKNVRNAIEKGEAWSVSISSGWRLRWIEESIEIWPCELHKPLNGSKNQIRAYKFCMFLMPTLMVMHSSSISVGYKMTYRRHSASIDINYVWSGEVQSTSLASKS